MVDYENGVAVKVRKAEGPRASSTTFSLTQPPMPDWMQARDYQDDATEKLVAGFERGARVMMLDAPTGCLAGETELMVNRHGGSKRMLLRDLHEKLQGRLDRGRGWDLEISTRVAQGNMDTLASRFALIQATTCSGMQNTVDLYLGRNRGQRRSIRLTPDHRVMTLNGWEPVADLTVHSRVLVNSKRTKSTTRPRRYYPRVTGVVGHPRRTGRDATVNTHVLVVEAEMNGMSPGTYVQALRSGANDFQFIQWPEYHVHHLNGDTEDFRLENLEVIQASEHHHNHSSQNSNFAFQLTWEPVMAIRPAGPTMTYDITMAEGGEHFLANDVYVHNSGKTAIAELVRRRLEVDRGLFICTTKTLQSQIAADFPYARVLKGRRNYLPNGLSGPDDPRMLAGGRGGVTCNDCDRAPVDEPLSDQTCSWCADVERCGYLVARAEAERAPVGVLNTSYLLAETNGPGRFKGRELVVCDEADLLEQELLGYVELRLGSGAALNLGVEVPKKGSHMTTIHGWLGEDVLPAIKEAKGRIRGRDLEARRNIMRLERLAADVTRVVDRPDGWVREGDEEDADGRNSRHTGNALVLKPVSVEDVGERYLWKHGERWLLMSGTTVSAEMQADALGLTQAGIEWDVVNVESQFEARNRRVVYVPAGNMTKKQIEVGRPKVMRALERVLEKHPDGNVLCHTFSYALANDTVRHLKGCDGALNGRPVITYASAGQRDRALGAFRAATRQNGAVLVASSMDRGIDLPGEMCRVQVVMKVPMPSLGSRQVNERLHAPGGDAWYRMGVIRTIMQMCGRAVRGTDDWAVTYVLDQFFGKTLKDGKRAGMWPQWWLDALESGRLREYV